jgi:hypothetical protein
MILFDELFLNEDEIKYLTGLWDNSKVEFSNTAIHFYYIDFVKHSININPIHKSKFSNIEFEQIRLQKYDDSFTQVTTYHGHRNYHNYILFLNDNFDGGELEFQNGLTIKPKKGGMVYFNNNEMHRVLPCKGDRFVFTLLGNNPVELDLKYLKKSAI